MSTLVRQAFDFAGTRIRTLSRDGEPLLCSADVCSILEHTNPAVAMRLLDADDKVRVNLRETDIPTINRTSPNPYMWFVTESGFYSLVFASRAPGARAFRRWVTAEVLPALRRTGRYEVAPPQPAVPQTYAEALRLAADQAERIEAQAARLAEVEPAAQSWDALVREGGDYSVADAAKILSRDPAIDVGQKRLFALLEQHGWIYRHPGDNRLHAYQVQVDNGRLREKISTYEHPRTGEVAMGGPTIRVTHKGLAALHKRLGGAAELNAAEPEPVAVEA